jgi:hypothetical protein
MKVLSMTQPWAFLVVYAIKHWETRSWRTAYRGPLAIHAAKAYPKEAREFAFEIFFELAKKGGTHPDLDAHPLLQPAIIPALVVADRIVRGAIIGSVELTDCVRVETIRELLSPTEIKLGNYSDGRYAWKLTNQRWFRKPIPAKGALGLWECKIALGER